MVLWLIAAAVVWLSIVLLVVAICRAAAAGDAAQAAGTDRPRRFTTGGRQRFAGRRRTHARG